VTVTEQGAIRTAGATGTPSEKRGMTLKLRIWRQNGPSDKGRMVTYQAADISPDMPFLEMLDVLNQQLVQAGDDAHFAYVAAGEWPRAGEPPVLHREALEYEYVHLAQRSYK